MEEIYELLEQFKALSKIYDLYIVGAGKFGTILGKWMNQNQINWKGYLDRQKAGGILNDKEIFNTFGVKGEKDYFIISSVGNDDEMRNDLIEQGIPDKRIFSFENTDLLYEIYGEIIDWRKYAEKIKKFKNCHADDKRCFVIGNGPSLRIEDLEMLRGEISFASNLIYALYDSTVWRPNYYCVYDTAICDRMMGDKESIKKMISGCEAAFTSIISKGFQFRDDEELKKLYFNKRSRHMFSDDCSETVGGAASTVACIMLQLAIYMGFKEIYLLGIDFTFSNERDNENTIRSKNVMNHMELIEKEEENYYQIHEKKYGYSYIANIQLQQDGYIAVKKYADEHGIKIYNATRGGKLEVFERVDFDTLFIGK